MFARHFTVNPRHLVQAAVLAAGLLAVAAPVGVAQAGPFSNWGSERVEGNGKLTTQQRQPGHFNALASSVGGHVEVRLGDSESVTVTTDENLQALIETVVEDGSLRIRPVRKNLALDTRKLKIVVQARALERISVAGSGAVIADKLAGERLQLDVGGSGSLTARELSAQSVAVALGGSGSLHLGGSTARLAVSIGGSGSVEASKLAAQRASVSVGGSGEVTLWARDALSVSVAGSGDIGYYGDPKLSTSVLGSGSVKRLGAAPL